MLNCNLLILDDLRSWAYRFVISNIRVPIQLTITELVQSVKTC